MEIPSHIFDEVGIGAAILLSLTGMLLQWRAHRHRMEIEERLKDDEIAEHEARRQLRFYQWCAPIATGLGILVLLVVLADLNS